MTPAPPPEPPPSFDEMNQMMSELIRTKRAGEADDSQMNEAELSKFQDALKEPEFHKLLADYMEELKDPKHREEQEAYIDSLERDNMVPAGKQLVRPEPHFVLKTAFRTGPSGEREKLFINIVSNEAVGRPVSTSVSGSVDGADWNIPNMVGPLRTETDRKGETATAIDVCFHPAVILSSKGSQRFAEMVYSVALDAAEKRLSERSALASSAAGGGATASVERACHRLQNVRYKSGQVQTLLVAADQVANGAGSGRREAHSARAEGSEAKTVPQTVEAAAEREAKEAPRGSAAEAKKGPSQAIRAAGAAVDGDSTERTAAGPRKGGAAQQPAKAQPLIQRGFLASKPAPKKRAAMSVLAPGAKAVTVSESTGGVVGACAPAGAKAQRPLVQEVEHGVARKAVAAAAPPVESESATRAPAITEVSTKRSAAVAPAPAANGAAAADSAPARARYTITERGILDLGDHMHMPGDRGGGAAPRKRPKELIVRIALPASLEPGGGQRLRASDLSLDIGERSLVLGTAAEPTFVHVALPYPVDESRGSAKYLKSGAKLEVTLPVRPPMPEPPPPLQPPAPPALRSQQGGGQVVEVRSPERGHAERVECERAGDQVDKAARAGQEEEEEVELAAGEDGEGLGAPEADHSRWINREPIGEKFVFPKREGTELPTDFGSGAAGPGAAAAAPEAAAADVAVQIASDPEPLAAANGGFLASERFAGARPGCAFKMGDRGLGYYVDSGLVMSAMEAPDSGAQAAKPSPLTAASPAFDWQQDEKTVSVIVDVPRVDADSVRVSCEDRRLELSFSAAGGEHRYCLRLRLAGEANPAQVRHDVADQNMLVVIGKRHETKWKTLEVVESEDIEAETTSEEPADTAARLLLRGGREREGGGGVMQFRSALLHELD